jgi:hypothetical protein
MALQHKCFKVRGMTMIAMVILLFPMAAKGKGPVRDGVSQELGVGGMLLAHRDHKSHQMELCCNEDWHRRGSHSQDSDHSDSAGNAHGDRDQMHHGHGHEWAHEKQHNHHHRHGLGWWKRLLAHRALNGVLMGSFVDEQQSDWTQTAKTYNYHPEEGLVVKVETVRVEPEIIEPGKPSKLILSYSILDPNSHENITVKESRAIMSGDDLLKQIGPRTVERTAGTFATEQEVTFPKELPEGLYALKGEVEAGGKTSSEVSFFRVAKIPTKTGYAYAVSEY